MNKQPTIDELFDRFENKELNKETYKHKNEIISEDIKTSDIKEIVNDIDEIVEVKYKNGEIYKTWTLKLIYPFIKEFIKEKVPESLIVQELNDIDFTILNKKMNYQIPVEIQKTSIHSGGTFSHGAFEDSIRRQIEDSTTNYDICWFFMDSEYLRFLQNGIIKRKTNINLTWLLKLMKEEKLKVFAIRYDGFVKELTIKDFDFLKNISQTCVISCDSDERILNRNKLKIYTNLMFDYNFTQEEIDNSYENFKNIKVKTKCKTYKEYLESHTDKRNRLQGNILHAIGNLSKVNNMLDMNNYNNQPKFDAIALGIFEVMGTHGHANLIRFVDKFDVCKYFPGYLRNKEQWDGYKGNNFTHSTFTLIANGSLKQQKIMSDY